MVRANVLVFLVMAWFVQGRTCQTLSDIQQSISEVRSDIKSILVTGPALLNNVKNLVNSIKTSKNTIEGLIGGLNSDITDTLAQARSLEEDISSCVNDVASSLSSLNASNILSPCVPQVDVVGLLKNITGLGLTLNGLSFSQTACFVTNLFDISGRIKCLSKAIDDVQSVVSPVKAQLEVLEGLSDLVQSCVDSLVSVASSEVATIQQNFDSCAQGVLNTATTIAPSVE